MAKRVQARSRSVKASPKAPARRVQPRPGRPTPAKAKPRGTVAPSSWPKVSVSPPPGPPAGAVAAFEAAVRELQRHKYAEASKRLKALLAAFPSESALLDRVRVFLGVCEREMHRKPVAPRTTEERLTLATAALNNGEDSAAERLASGVLSDSPDHDLALYLLAAVLARRGDTSAALVRLQRAVAVSPDVRAQARHDADFESLRELPGFQALLETPVNGAPALQARRAKRARSGR